MRRATEKSAPRVEKVQKIELSDSHKRLRLVAAIFFLLLGVGLLTYTFVGFLSGEAGWTTVTVLTSDLPDCGSEFVLRYNFGTEGRSAADETRAVRALYTEAAQKAYKLFNTYERFDDTVSVCEINCRPNEIIEVDEVLYNAFSLFEKYGLRTLYLGPVYARYSDLFFCNDDTQLVRFDPRLSDEVKTEYQTVCAYANAPEDINIELLGENKIRLRVSERYLEYAKNEEITDFIDFYWTKNAFIADYFAGLMTSRGFTAGSVTSYNGFTRNFGKGDTDYSFNIFDKNENGLYQAAALCYKAPESFVFLHDYKINSMSDYDYYTLANGETRTTYIDTADAYCKSALSGLVVYCENAGCAETLMRVIPIYIADSLDEGALSALSADGIYGVYCKERTIICTDKNAVLADIYCDDTVKYTVGR